MLPRGRVTAGIISPETRVVRSWVVRALRALISARARRKAERDRKSLGGVPSNILFQFSRKEVYERLIRALRALISARARRKAERDRKGLGGVPSNVLYRFLEKRVHEPSAGVII